MLTLGLAGCVTPHESEFWPPPLEESELLVQPGDTLRFDFAYWPELDDEQTIRSDGKVSLQLIGEVQCADRSLAEIRAELLERYAKDLRDPEINVSVADTQSQRVYVGGEVLRPGVIPIVDRLTVVDAIVEAGGFNNNGARIGKVLLVREREGTRYAKIVDVKKNLSSPEHAAVYLEPYDVVYVPRTAIDRVDQWVDQYINKILPDNVTWTILTNTESTDVGDADFQTSFGVQ